MELIWILIGFFALCTMVFIVIAIFLPEWVGITGKKALEIQKHQQTDENKQQDGEKSPPLE
ncbi:hypothetical protein [Pseudobdellovibrio sp. HCB154]|uniref:hypothetical protein n=1 Tax=Pseudobdellovibrio sp. HCB154 TaxID=3386277 RepID=UPI0039175F0F